MSNARSPHSALPGIVIAASQYHRLLSLADRVKEPANPICAYLARELDRAQVLSDDEIDATVARIGSRVTYRDDVTGRERSVRLAWPENSDIEQGSVSVLSPIGAALLGMRPDNTIDWPAPVGGPRTLTVLHVHNGEDTGPEPPRAA